MIAKKACSAAVTVALILSCVAFPGGAVLCRERDGGLKLEPFHAPHVSLCIPSDIPSNTPEASCGAHEHELCSDSAASDHQAPARTITLRPAGTSDPGVKHWTQEQPLSVASMALPCPSAGSIAEHISTTILRT